MKLEEILRFDCLDDFQQLSCVSDRFYLCGGDSPLSGQRSAYSAKAECRDGMGKVMWQFVRSKSKPFELQEPGETSLACVVPFNFVREPSGIQLLDLSTGEQGNFIEIQVVVSVKYLAELKQFRCVALNGGQLLLRDFNEETGKLEREFLFPGFLGGVASAVCVGLDCILLAVALEDGAFSIELWRLSGLEKAWALTSKNAIVKCSGDTFFATSDHSKEIEEIDVSNGKIRRRFSVPQPPYCGPIVYEEKIVWGNEKRQLVLTEYDKNFSRKLDQFEVSSPRAFEITSCPNEGEIAALCVTDFTEPRSQIRTYKISD